MVCPRKEQTLETELQADRSLFHRRPPTKTQGHFYCGTTTSAFPLDMPSFSGRYFKINSQYRYRYRCLNPKPCG
jgi:hypothetical protein